MSSLDKWNQSHLSVCCQMPRAETSPTSVTPKLVKNKTGDLQSRAELEGSCSDCPRPLSSQQESAFGCERAGLEPRGGQELGRLVLLLL